MRFPFSYRFAVVGPLVAALGIVPLACGPTVAAPIEITATPVALNEKDPAQTTVGKLKYRGGVVLKSPEGRFGGLSALAVSADGQRLIAISDKGHRLDAKILYTPEGNLAGLAEADLGSLAGEDGRPLSLPSERDAEGMAVGPAGEVIVSFERDHRFLRYLPGQAKPDRIPEPEELKFAPSNGGVEGIAFLKDGRLLAIAEELKRGNRAVGWVSDVVRSARASPDSMRSARASPRDWSVLTYALDGGFSVSDLALLPSGDVLALERRYTLRLATAVRVRRIPAAAIVPGAELDAELIAELRPPLTMDNMEGLAARQDAAGRTLVYMISDDNFTFLQKTLLLMFEIMD